MTIMPNDKYLYRNIHPDWLHSGEPSSQAYKPTTKDKGMLSCHDGDLISAEDSWNLHARQMKLKSTGVMAITTGECEQLALSVVPDPDTFPEHILIDFLGLSRRQAEKKADSLKIGANSRGWQYGPVSQP